MDFLFGTANNLGVLSYIIPFLVVLTVVVFFHELGHFLVARWCGVKVESFSIGFGREILGWTDKHATRWKIGWLPLGGYVKFLGDEDVTSTLPAEDMSLLNETEKAHSFHCKPLPQRAAIVAAGPIANFILAIVIYTFLFSVFGERLTAPVVGEVTPKSAAAEAGFRVDDEILSIDGDKIASFNELARIVSDSDGSELAFEVARDGQVIALSATPRMEPLEDIFGNVHERWALGVRSSDKEGRITIQNYDPVSALWRGVGETYFVVDRTLGYLWDVIIGVQSAKQIGGPLGIAKVSGQVASLSVFALINLIAVLSVSIGLLNLFPVPMLDGGHLLYYGIEAIRGRPLGARAQEYGFRVGLALIVMLMVFATWNDFDNMGVFKQLRGLLS